MCYVFSVKSISRIFLVFFFMKSLFPRIFFSVTHENEENCQYLLKYENGKCLDLIHKLFKLLDEELPLNPNK